MPCAGAGLIRAYFYPRPPRGGRLISIGRSSHIWVFLSTPSARRATGHDLGAGQGVLISIHALREEGDRLCPCPGVVFTISIHALREEGDFPSFWQAVRFLGFLSTPSARRATAQPRATAARGAISIHALREEGDSGCKCHFCTRDNFYPRPPRGGRPKGITR